MEFKREQTAEPYDFDAVLPLELIREHTKTDDVVSVSDDMLKLYRKGALSAAEKYTGLLLTERKTITEPVPRPRVVYGRYFDHGIDPNPSTITVKVKHPLATTQVFYYGLPGVGPKQVVGEIGSRTIRLPRQHSSFGLDCCNPCGMSDSYGYVQYVAGFGSEVDFPPEVILGALKYIAHAVQHAGDNVIAMSASGATTERDSATSDAANPALASGAIDIWRTVRVDA